MRNRCRGIFAHIACSPNIPDPTSTIAFGILRLATRRKGGLLQEHVIVSTRCNCYSLARFVLPPSWIWERMTIRARMDSMRSEVKFCIKI
jgi:hypothetical protein